jgi:ADP-heptose:LPS heptosyltransferase
MMLAKKPINDQMHGVTDQPRRIILCQNQSPGDILTFTRALADLKAAYPHFEINVDTPCPDIFENNPHLTGGLNKLDPTVEYHNIRYDTINESGWRGHHFADGFRIAVEQALGIPIPSGGHTPQLFLSDEERGWWNLPHCEYGYDGPYWVINAGRKQDNELKQYHRWVEVAELFNERFRGEVRLVQMGHPSHIHPPLPGVLSAVGKANSERELIRMIYWAQGTIGPISFQMVISAAFNQPAVCVAGGKEGIRWHLYNQMRWLHTVGALPCCVNDGCWKGGTIGGCVDLVDGAPKCFTLITPQQIVDAVSLYYDGGRLVLPGKQAVPEKEVTV